MSPRTKAPLPSDRAPTTQPKARSHNAIDKYPTPPVPLAPETYAQAARKLRAWGDLDVLDMLGLSEVA